MLERRHYWRQVSFSELSELYTSVMLRSMGLSLVGIFIPIYLYQQGFSLSVIFLFYIAFFAARASGDIIAGYSVAAKGPKHVILYSYLLQIISMLLLLMVPAQPYLLWTTAVTWGVSNSLYFVAFNVDISKVLHQDHGGKELGFMSIMERFGGALGPLAGGIIATLFGAQYTIGIAAILLIFAAIPLFLTAEPVKLHQKLDFKLLPYKKLKYDFMSFAAHTAENTLTLSLWPLYVSIIIFTTNPYAGVGVAASVGVVAAMLSAHVIGRLVDNKKGTMLLEYGSYVAAAVHLTRPFIGSTGGVLLANATGETAMTAFRLSYLRGMYDRADNLPGQRIAYIVAIEVIGDLSKIVPWVLLWLLSLSFSMQLTMQLGFMFAAVAAVAATVQRYPALKA